MDAGGQFYQHRNLIRAGTVIRSVVNRAPTLVDTVRRGVDYLGNYGVEFDPAGDIPGFYHLAPETHDNVVGFTLDRLGFEEGGSLPGDRQLRNIRQRQRDRRTERNRPPAGEPPDPFDEHPPRRRPVDKVLKIGYRQLKGNDYFEPDTGVGLDCRQAASVIFQTDMPGTVTGFHWTFQVTAIFAWPVTICVVLYVRHQGEDSDFDFEFPFISKLLPGDDSFDLHDVCGDTNNVICEELISGHPTGYYSASVGDPDYENYQTQSVRGKTNISRRLRQGDSLNISMRMFGQPKPADVTLLDPLVNLSYLIHFFFKT